MKMRSYPTLWLVMAILAGAALSVMALTSQSVRAAGPWYVAPGGSDVNTCTAPNTACATINGALSKPGFIAGDTIRVATGVYTGTGDQVVLLDKNVTLSGGWNAGFATQSGASTIDGEGARRGITVNSGVTATVERFVVQNCSSGVYTSGILTLNNSTVSRNSAGGGIVISGGGGTLTLNSSTVSNNMAVDGGGISNWGIVTLNNSTVSSNTASGGYGGGIISQGGGTLTLNSSTVSNNMAVHGGGISNWGALTLLQNTIVAGNTAGSQPDCSGVINSAGYNLISSTSDCTFTSGTGDLTNINAGLGLLIGAPGQSKYHPLLPGSPAIDAGNPAGCMGSAGLLTIDQRGAARVGRCDIGAYEYTTPGPADTVYAFAGTPQHAPPLDLFGAPLQAGVLDSIGSPVNNSTVTFSAPVGGASGTFSDTGTRTTTAVTNESGLATAATFTANGVAGSFVVTATVSGVMAQANFSLSNILWYVTTSGNNSDDCLSPATACATINGGLSKPGFIAGDTIRVATGTYTGAGEQVVLLDKSVILSGGWDASFTSQSGASTIDGEGARRGMNANNGITVVIERFAIQNCAAAGDGGGIRVALGTLTLNNSTVSGNTAGGQGAGIYWNSGALTLNNSTVNGNKGVGIDNYYGNLTLNSTTVSKNTGGGIRNDHGTVTLNSSTVSGNTTSGGIVNHAGTATLNNSTVSGNTSGVGGGISNEYVGTLILNSSTVSGNTAGSAVGGIASGDWPGAVTLRNSILSDNTADSKPDCAGLIGSAGYNLIGNTSDCTFSTNTGDLTNVDPKLGPLEGSPGYHPLLPGSPALDAGNPAGCQDDQGILLSTDQRIAPLRPLRHRRV